jgi:hypothetical protein
MRSEIRFEVCYDGINAVGLDRSFGEVGEGCRDLLRLMKSAKGERSSWAETETLRA